MCTYIYAFRNKTLKLTGLSDYTLLTGLSNGGVWAAVIPQWIKIQTPPPCFYCAATPHTTLAAAARISLLSLSSLVFAFGP